MEKLKIVLTKIFSFVHTPVSIHVPIDDEQKTKGYCFIEYETPEQTSAAAKVLDGHDLDKNHKFAAYILSAMRDLQKPDENWSPPAKKDYVDAVITNMRFFIIKKNCRVIFGGGFKTQNAWISLLFKQKVVMV